MMSDKTASHVQLVMLLISTRYAAATAAAAVLQ